MARPKGPRRKSVAAGGISRPQDGDDGATAEAKWEDFSLEDYRSVAARLVHASFKSINSNTSIGGIRLGTESALDMGYLCMRTLIHADIPLKLEYTTNNYTASNNKPNQTARIVKQIRLLKDDQAPVSPEERSAILATVAEASQGRYEEGLESVNPRLRQLLLPRDDSYAAVTPLPGAGLLSALAEAVRRHNGAAWEQSEEQRKTGTEPALRRLRLAHLGIGGSNSQNVGSLVRDMQTQIVLGAPEERAELRAALAIHHRGVSLAPPRSLLAGYLDWQAENADRTTAEVRRQEAAWIRRLVEAVLVRGRQARELLEEHGPQLPQREDGQPLWLGEQVPSLIRGLILPKERERDWSRRFAHELAKEIVAFKTADGQSLPYGDRGLTDIAAWIEEAVR